MTTVSTTWVHLVSNLLIFIGILLCFQFIHHKIGADWKFPIVLYYWNAINTALFIVMINIYFNTYPYIRQKTGPPGPVGPQGKPGKNGPIGIS